MDAVIYIHGKGGSAAEAERYKSLFPDCDVTGLEYGSFTPWDAGEEIRESIISLRASRERIILIANSIGAYFSMHAGIEDYISHAFFISPVVDMEGLICGMMSQAGVTEEELRRRKTVHTGFGEDLSWDYLCYVRKHPVSWNTQTDILYGGKDNLTPLDTITSFAEKHNATLTVMENGEHWFHTEAQMRFLDNWIKNKCGV